LISCNRSENLFTLLRLAEPGVDLVPFLEVKGDARMKQILVLSALLLSPVTIPHARADSAISQNEKLASNHDQKTSANRFVHRTSSGRNVSLSCSPAPCVLPNVLITAEQAYNTILIANPAKPSHLLAGLDSSYGGIWSQAKRKLSNSCPKDIDELMEDIIQSINGVRRSQKKLRGCTEQSELPSFLR
jgi:hypothetical protein